ncbi:hypothetical protein CAEBREN_18763 [Caenorhabditis brenneri]|uniref:Uncharacterized protein n=1 Tax=Caenorhabditis brenneri TaxID=135651 RepID=G0N1L5_CAEBE|nr:hypothetical protein CAEBREN_18763 [Caenorhabditis brenneri]
MNTHTEANSQVADNPMALSPEGEVYMSDVHMNWDMEVNIVHCNLSIIYRLPVFTKLKLFLPIGFSILNLWPTSLQLVMRGLLCCHRYISVSLGPPALLDFGKDIVKKTSSGENRRCC